MRSHIQTVKYIALMCVISKKMQTDRILTFVTIGDTKPPSQAFCPINHNSSEQRCVIADQLPFTNYSVRVQAYTFKGASEITDKFYVQTLEDGECCWDSACIPSCV